MKENYRIEQLVDLTGLSRRSIRYFVQKGLIKPPTGRGRGAFYDDDHLKTIREIRSLRDKGLRLSKIREKLKSQTPGKWTRYELTPGLEIHINCDLEKQRGMNMPGIIKVLKIFCLQEEERDE
jgi:DNA-binding transcriptional MerR regulator